MGFRGDRGRGRGAPRGARGFGPPAIFSPPGAANTIDSRLTDKSQDALIQSFQALKIKPASLPLRPGFGTVGRSVNLRANFFPVKIPKGSFYEYNVTITPAAGLASRRIKRRIFQLAEGSPGWTRFGLQGLVAHDHSSKLIAAKKLVQPIQISIVYFDEDDDGPNPNARTYTLEITFVQAIETEKLLQYVAGDLKRRDNDILPIISALNLILSAHPNRSSVGSGVLVGRSKFFFRNAAAPFDLGGGLEAWRGFYSSVRPTHKQLMVNVNVCTTAFYKTSNLATALIEFERASFGASFNTFAQRLRVKTLHLNYKKTIKTVTSVLPKDHFFQADEFGKVSVEIYFRKKYNITLRYPKLPLVDVGSTKQNLLPPELCDILPNQPFRGKLSSKHTEQMIKTAANPPAVNASAIVDKGLLELGFKTRTEPMQSFGISVGNEMTVVPGRVLPLPAIRYGSGVPRIDASASWNLRDVKFRIPARLTRWLVLLLHDGSGSEFSNINDRDFLRTVNEMKMMCSNSGMQVTDPRFLEVTLPQKSQRSPTRSDAIAHLQSEIRKGVPGKPTFMLVILANDDKHIFNGLKHLMDIRMDVPTVCVLAEKIRKLQPSYFANVSLKINMKMGGVNHTLDAQNQEWLQREPTMMVGIDVTHPGYGSVTGTPSIAAVVASIDSNYAQYPASMRLQESKKEMVTNLTDMMVERLVLFRTKSRKLPSRILVYRDGVSEGQFPIVVDDELPKIKKAFSKFDSPNAKYAPKLTIVICGKRHHTRFYPMSEDGADSKGNPKAGTVVDRGVTSVYEYDFFLQAHSGLQGSTRPTHYYVVHDEIGFQADTIQTLTNAVSYTFSRATRAVSLVTPAYYADLCCERGRCYIHELFQGVTNVNLNTPNADADVMREAMGKWGNGVAGEQSKDIMYYI